MMPLPDIDKSGFDFGLFLNTTVPPALHVSTDVLTADDGALPHPSPYTEPASVTTNTDSPGPQEYRFPPRKSSLANETAPPLQPAPKSTRAVRTDSKLLMNHSPLSDNTESSPVTPITSPNKLSCSRPPSNHSPSPPHDFRPRKPSPSASPEMSLAISDDLLREGRSPRKYGEQRPPLSPAPSRANRIDRYARQREASKSPGPPDSRCRGLTVSSNASSRAPPSLHSLRTSTSIPDLGFARTGMRKESSGLQRVDGYSSVRDSYQSSLRREPIPWRDAGPAYEARASFRSAWTSSGYYTSDTERSSVVTKATSVSDYGRGPVPPGMEDSNMSVEDAIGMYEDGFHDDSDVPPEQDEPPPVAQPPPWYTARRDRVSRSPESLRPAGQFELSQPLRKVRSAESIRTSMLVDAPPKPKAKPTLAPPAEEPTELVRSSAQIFDHGALSSHPPNSPIPSPRLPPTTSNSPPVPTAPVPRDRYGFKKSNQYYTEEQYDAWNATYTPYIERRRKKWYALMKAYGLTTESPIRFPPKSEKVKRYVRKGIPPEWRGIAWFWYAGGPGRLARMQGVYWDLVRRCEKPESEGGLSDADREHIERDLHRTFPDNISFKPDIPLSDSSDPHRHQPSPSTSEPPILSALRRVLRAFALHNLQIGYCQSLNFLAGLLLLFLKSDEEKAFILLDVITSVHLPGTHARVLEANVDIGVLMDLLREHLPAVWNKIDDGDPIDAQPAPGKRPLGMSGNPQPRLPTVSLATTPWFMSLFVGTLPIETTLRVWDSLFYEGSKSIFRASLAIFKLGEPAIRAIEDPMEVFQVVQTLPRKMLDVNGLMEACWKRKGFGSITQDLIEERRRWRRRMLKGSASAAGVLHVPGLPTEAEERESRGVIGGLRRAASRARATRSASKARRKMSEAS